MKRRTVEEIAEVLGQPVERVRGLVRYLVDSGIAYFRGERRVRPSVGVKVYEFPRGAAAKLAAEIEKLESD